MGNAIGLSAPQQVLEDDDLLLLYIDGLPNRCPGCGRMICGEGYCCDCKPYFGDEPRLCRDCGVVSLEGRHYQVKFCELCAAARTRENKRRWNWKQREVLA
jgi:hypothetical protein